MAAWLECWGQWKLHAELRGCFAFKEFFWTETREAFFVMLWNNIKARQIIFWLYRITKAGDLQRHMKKHRRREALADVYMVSGQWIAMLSRFHLVKWNFIQLSFNPGTILDYARTFPQFGKAPWSSCDIKDRAENLTLSVCASDGNNFP